MAQCKVNKIAIVCEKWKRKTINTEQAMSEVQQIIDTKESEMPPCTCKPKSNEMQCSTSKASGSCPMPKGSGSCPKPVEDKCGSCHSPGPRNALKFIKFMTAEIECNKISFSNLFY